MSDSFNDRYPAGSVHHVAFQLAQHVCLLRSQTDDIERQAQDLITLCIQMVAKALKELPKEDVSQWLQDLYWLDEVMAEVTQKASIQVLGKSFRPDIYYTDFYCQRCEQYTRIGCHTWQIVIDLRSIEFICPACQDGPSSEELHRLKTMPYPEYLQTQHWQILRKQALKQAGNCCQLCNQDSNLHVHHRTYERRGCELLSDLTVLCKTCHQHFHRLTAIADNS